MYLDSGAPAKRNDSARLESFPLSKTSEARCLSFYYHMFGQHIDTLNVYIRDTINETIIWTKKGNQGNTWVNGKVNVYSTETFFLIFEAIRGTSYLVNEKN